MVESVAVDFAVVVSVAVEFAMEESDALPTEEFPHPITDIVISVIISAVQIDFVTVLKMGFVIGLETGLVIGFVRLMCFLFIITYDPMSFEFFRRHPF